MVNYKAVFQLANCIQRLLELRAELVTLPVPVDCQAQRERAIGQLGDAANTLVILLMEWDDRREDA